MYLDFQKEAGYSLDRISSELTFLAKCNKGEAYVEELDTSLVQEYIEWLENQLEKQSNL